LYKLSKYLIVVKTLVITYHKTKIGEFVLGAYDGQLCLMDFRYRKMRDRVDRRLKSELKATFVERDDELLKIACGQLDEYLDGTRQTFDLPLLMVGSEFQQKVWRALMEIPYGETASYLSLANAIDTPKSVRAVANANGANAIALIVPCHRIIGSDGQLVGYGGGLNIKKRLLNMELTHGESTLHKKNWPEQESLPF